MRFALAVVLLVAACSDTKSGSIAGESVDGVDRDVAGEYAAFYNDNPPFLITAVPADGGVLEAVVPTLVLSFSEPLDPASLNAITVIVTRDAAASQQLAVEIAVSSNVVLLTGIPGFAPGAHTVVLTTGIRDLTGTPMTDERMLRFTVKRAALTEEQRNGAQPYLVSTSPPDGSVLYSRSPSLIMEFSEPVSAEPGDVSLSDQNGNAVVGSVTAVGSLLLFTPSAPLQAGLDYTLRGSTNIHDDELERISNEVVLHFSIDGVPPDALTSSANAALGHIDLQWSSSAAPDLSRYVLVRRSDRAPTTTDDGDVVYSGQLTSFSDTAARSAPHYFYALFAVDTADNASPPAQAEADTVFAIRLNVTSAAPSVSLPELVCEIFAGTEERYVVPTYRIVVPVTGAATELISQVVPYGAYQYFCYRDAGDHHPLHAPVLAASGAERTSPVQSVSAPELCTSEACQRPVTVDRAFRDYQGALTTIPDHESRPSFRREPSMIPRGITGLSNEADACGGAYLLFQHASFVDVADCRMHVGREQSNATLHPLSDDGGCDRYASDLPYNTHQSFDKKAGDGKLSFGLRDPAPSDSGDYVYQINCDQGGDKIIGRHKENIPTIINLPQPWFNGPFASPSPPSFMCNFAVPFASPPLTGACAVTNNRTPMTLVPPPTSDPVTDGIIAPWLFPYTLSIDQRINLARLDNLGYIAPLRQEAGDPYYASGWDLSQNQDQGAGLPQGYPYGINRWAIFPEYEVYAPGVGRIAYSTGLPLVYASYKAGDEDQIAKVTGQITHTAGTCAADRPLLGFYVFLNATPIIFGKGVAIYNTTNGFLYDTAHAATFVQAVPGDGTTTANFELLLHTENHPTLDVFVSAFAIYDDGNGYPKSIPSFYTTVSTDDYVTISAGATTAVTQVLSTADYCD